LIGLAQQVAYWNYFQRPSPITPASLAQACASLFLHGAASIPDSFTKGGTYA
jgi:hypothetical protein